MNPPTRPKKKLAQVGMLCNLLSIEPSDLIKYSTTVYQWKEVIFEVRGYKDIRKGHKSGGTPVSHYTKYEWGGKTWGIRELGDKSAIVKALKKGKYGEL